MISTASSYTAIPTDIDGDGDADIVTSSGQLFKNRAIGDSNDDGKFNSSDLVEVFEAGKYEDGIPDNATFDEGDWNLDGDFNSGDIVLAFQFGEYVRDLAAKSLMHEIAASIDCVIAVGEEFRNEPVYAE